MSLEDEEKEGEEDDGCECGRLYKWYLCAIVHFANSL